MGEADVVKANSSSQDAQSSTSAISDSQVVSVLSFSSISNVVGPLPLSSSRGRSLLQLSAGWDPSMCAQTHTAPPDLVPTISTTEAAHTTQGGFIGQNTPFPTISSFPPSNPHIPRLLQTTLGPVELKQTLPAHSKVLTGVIFAFCFLTTSFGPPCLTIRQSWMTTCHKSTNGP